MGFLTTVRLSARKTKLWAEVSILDREIYRKESLFGIHLYDTITTFHSNNSGKFPSIADFVKQEFEKHAKQVKLIEDQIFIKNKNIYLDRGIDYDPSLSDTTNEAVVRLQISSLERSIRKTKESFGVAVSSAVLQQMTARSTSCKIRSEFAILNLMEYHTTDISSLYRQRDSKKREIHASEGPLDPKTTTKHSAWYGDTSNIVKPEQSDSALHGAPDNSHSLLGTSLNVKPINKNPSVPKSLLKETKTISKRGSNVRYKKKPEDSVAARPKVGSAASVSIHPPPKATATRSAMKCKHKDKEGLPAGKKTKKFVRFDQSVLPGLSESTFTDDSQQERVVEVVRMEL